jgi:hypothetical protein
MSLILRTQGIFYLVSGLWPLFHMQSFLSMTGPKEELWLVKTVGALTAVIGSILLMAGLRRQLHFEIFFLAFFSALTYSAIDLIYYFSGILSITYFLDGLFEILLLVLLLIFFLRKERNVNKTALL